MGGCLSLNALEKSSFKKLFSHTRFEFFLYNCQGKSIVCSAIILGLKLQMCSNAIKILGTILVYSKCYFTIVEHRKLYQTKPSHAGI